jgi:hypothetical protein
MAAKRQTKTPNPLSMLGLNKAGMTAEAKARRKKVLARRATPKAGSRRATR